jgi:hypothetical protein
MNDYLIHQLSAATSGHVLELVKASVGLGLLEQALTAKAGATQVSQDELVVCCRTSSLLFTSRWCGMLCGGPQLSQGMQQDDAMKLTLSMATGCVGCCVHQQPFRFCCCTCSCLPPLMPISSLMLQAQMEEGAQAFQAFAHQLAAKAGVASNGNATHAAAALFCEAANNDCAPAVAVQPVVCQSGGSEAAETPYKAGPTEIDPCPATVDIAEARRIVKVLVKELVDCVAMGSAMPADGKHRQHLSQWFKWWRAGRPKKGLQLDCAGLSLAVLCLARALAPAVPALERVALVVRSLLWQHVVLQVVCSLVA